MRKKLKEAINNRKHTHYGTYYDVEIVLDKYSIPELVEYYIKNLRGETSLRYYLHQQIIAEEINNCRRNK